MATPPLQNLDIDVLIVTALDEEFNVLEQYLPPLTSLCSQESDNFYYVCDFPTDEPGEYLRLAVMCLYAMGNTNAAAAAANALFELRPSIVIMFGLAGGVRGRVELADVIISDRVVYYELGKHTPDEMQRRPVVHQVDARLLSSIRNFERSTRASCRVKFGPFAVGEKVIADARFVATLEAHAPKLLGIEMESSGVAVAVHRSALRSRFISVRGVSDFADEVKNDDYRERALQHAAQFLSGFLHTAGLALADRRPGSGGEPEQIVAIHHLSLERRPSPHDFLARCVPGRSKEDVHVIEVDQCAYFDNGSVLDPAAAYCEQTHLVSQLDEKLRQQPSSKLAYMGFAHVPFVFDLGYRINRREIEVYGLNRHDSTWNVLANAAATFPSLEVDGLPTAPLSAAGEVVLCFSVSALVVAEQVTAAVSAPIAAIHLRVAEPTLDILQSQTQLASYTGTFRRTLTMIYQLIPAVRTVHIFFAGPPALAFRCGQQISKTMDRDIRIHNFSRRDQPHYRWSLDLFSGQIIDLAQNGNLGGAPNG
ncbi:MAG: SAVED domain-containing protein [Caldilineaceae bacterium]